MMNKKALVGVGMFFCVLFFGFYLYDEFYLGEYIIEDMWIGSVDGAGIKICDECLHITFYEGCNRYRVFYFEEQHELDKRLKLGNAVNIYWQKIGLNYHIKHIRPAYKYQMKC